MKKIISIILIIAFLLFLTGCTDLIKDPHKNEDRMKFKENITINYGKKMLIQLNLSQVMTVTLFQM